MRFRGGRASASGSLNSEDRFVAGNLTNATGFSYSLFFSVALTHSSGYLLYISSLSLSLLLMPAFHCWNVTLRSRRPGKKHGETKRPKKAEIVVLKEAGNPVRFIHWYLMNHVLRKCLRAALTVRCITGSYTEVILLWEMIHDHW